MLKRIAVVTLLLFLFTVATATAYITENTRTIYSTPYSYTDTVRNDYVDIYRISLSSGQTISITLNTLSGDADLGLARPSGVVVASSSRSGTATDSITNYQITESGTWQIKVYGFGSPSSRYTLSVSVTGGVTTTPTPTPANDQYEPNNERSSAKRISTGTSIRNLYLTADDDDWFYFTITSTRHVVIETFYTRSPAVDTVMSLIGSDGSAWGTNDDGGSGWFSKIETNLPAGTYYIYVRSYGSSTGYYGLRVTTSAPPVTTTPTPTPTPVYRPPTPTPTPTATPVGGGAVPPEFSQVSQWVWDNIVRPWVINPITGIINTVSSGVSGVISDIFKGVSDIVTQVFKPIVDTLKSVGDAVVGVFNTISEAIQNVVRNVFFGGGGT